MQSKKLSRREAIAGLTLAAAVFSISGPAIAAPDGKKSVVIYFSRTGTVEGLAKEVAKVTGADIIRLDLKEPYAPAYSDMTDIARNERASGARREIATDVGDLSAYENVFIGTPYWWGGISIPMRTFLTDHPMAGKRLMPFVVSASSSPAGAWEDIRRICTEAKIEKGFHVTQSQAPGSTAELHKWLKELGF